MTIPLSLRCGPSASRLVPRQLVLRIVRRASRSTAFDDHSNSLCISRCGADFCALHMLKFTSRTSRGSAGKRGRSGVCLLFLTAMVLNVDLPRTSDIKALAHAVPFCGSAHTAGVNPDDQLALARPTMLSHSARNPFASCPRRSLP
ncbi:hypothetical protein EXIGLDRAFT_179323 [Exidia glandulosa HHB12029]|uniref:Uncharacterized protein n=1 Tax=Exidia glandulosa HHB12029 TaxID=1314781 RepID=A0A165F4A6_EXIGL|nr:hypothetical protein EXIGLDRAFT_179323 [Exidia glandulosa HHB12029]